MPFFEDSIRSNGLLFFSGNIGAQFLQNIKTFINQLLLQKRDLPWNSIDGIGPFFRFSTILVIPGLVWLIQRLKTREKSKKQTGLWLFTSWCAVAFLGCLMINGGNLNRLNIALYPISILIGLGILQLVGCIKKIPLKRAVAAALCVFYLISLGVFVHAYFSEPGKVISKYSLEGFDQALNEAAAPLELQGENEEILYVSTYIHWTRRCDSAEIVTLFYLKIDPKWFQGNPSYECAYYSDRIRYVDFGELTLEEIAGEKQSFVFSKDDMLLMKGELHQYLQSNYEITWFERFASAVK